VLYSSRESTQKACQKLAAHEQNISIYLQRVVFYMWPALCPHMDPFFIHFTRVSHVQQIRVAIFFILTNTPALVRLDRADLHKHNNNQEFQPRPNRF
jgi:hypothetical protein